MKVTTRYYIITKEKHGAKTVTVRKEMNSNYTYEDVKNIATAYRAIPNITEVIIEEETTTIKINRKWIEQ